MVPMDEEQVLTQEEEVVRGRRAQALMRDPLIREAFSSLDKAFYQAFMDTPPQDHDTLSHIRLLIKCLQEFQWFFSDAIATGQLTAKQVEERIHTENEQDFLERQRLNRYNQ